MALLRDSDVLPEVSEGSLELARMAFDWRTLDAELAELVADSALEQMVALRAAATPRMVSFESQELAIELELDTRDDVCAITGQLFPPQAATVHVIRPAGTPLRVEADAGGRFVVEIPAGGPVAFDVMSIRTDWLVT
ncbi:hypothetical protein OJ997_34085 [Solirubrobacter phytolaccae]|uniref:Uncharacterized protein n=1 Tax=Solirubrobacter phytolaccae TaxID=1404360 RepID=A0A9X3NFY0_9ACTN|nr:hypothetical protein [Solirubrobacter phytolaccae]MDA0185386.1 hypothetical protein [Solirubrobacter phytolaccae]